VSKLAFVDIETTGMSTYADRVIEVGILVLDGKKVVKKYSQLVDPEIRVSSFITSVTGISNQDLDGAPTFHQVAQDMLEILEGCTFVAHNVRFDYGFLKAEFERAGYQFKMPHFCTVRLSRALYPEHKRHGLDFIIKSHGIKCSSRHRAFADAEVICKFYRQQLKKIGAEKLAEVVAGIGKRISWPAHVPKEDIESLPRCPGVYVFYGENDAPLYVGKSVDIKSRVLSHFSDDIRSSKEMKLVQLVRRIEAHKTAGEFGALVKESQMVKDLMPLYNRMLRKSSQLTLLKGEIGPDGYMRMKIASSHEEDIQPNEIESIYGVFRSKSQAVKALMKISDEHKLCRKLLGLEKTDKRCFGYQLKKCSGACLQEEPAGLYNVRFELAFLNLRFKKWPYRQPVKVVEETEAMRQSYVIDRWCLFKAGDSDEPITEDFRFDVDIYKILKSFLLNPKNRKSIVVMGESGV
jgi:DNA polymerase III subunit epsilon